MKTSTVILLVVLGIVVGLSAGLHLGKSELDNVKSSAKRTILEATDDAYVYGRQSTALDCLKTGFALLPARKDQEVPAVLICNKSQLQTIPEEDVEQVTPRLNARPEYDIHFQSI